MQLSRRRGSVDFWEDSQPSNPPAPSRPKAELIAVGLCVVGVALVAWAYHKAKTEAIGLYDAIFWAGMAIVYLTVLWRAVSGRYAVLWLGFLGLFTVLPKFLMSPNNPIYFDETAHFSLLQSTISAGQTLPVLAVAAYRDLLSGHGERCGDDPLADRPLRVGFGADPACRGALPAPGPDLLHSACAPSAPSVGGGGRPVYATNPSFVYEDVQFAYESLAITLMLVIVRVYLESLEAERNGGRTWRESVSTAVFLVVMSFGCVVTHHLTSLTGIGLLLAAALFVKPFSGFLDRKAGWRRAFVRYAPVLAFGGIFSLWVFLEAPGTVPYLFPHVSQPFSQLAGLAGGSKGGVLRGLFSHSTAPKYEQISAIAAPVIISLALLFVVIRWLWKRQLRRRANFFWSFLLAAAYLVSLPLTLVAEGAAGAHRTWASSYVGVGLLPAAIVFFFELGRRRQWLRRTAAAAGAVILIVLLIGNIASGTPTDYRFPGPYKFASDTLSVTPETITLVQWVKTHLGPSPHIVTDRYTAVALSGRANAFTPLQTGQYPIAEFWYNRRPPEPALMYALQKQGDDYLAVDMRDTTNNASTAEAPLFVAGEPNIVPARDMTRLGQWPWLTLLYSSQNYRLYRINFVMYYLWYASHAYSE